MKRILLTLGAVVVLAGLSVLVLTQAPTLAQGAIQEGINSAQGDGQPTQLFGGDTSIFTRVVNIMLFIVGVLSVIMLIIGGIRYVVSGGNSTAVTAAKNTILYAIVGLIVAFLAFAIVRFVLGAVTTGSGTNV